MLADATRVQVLWSLADREMSVNELAEQVGKPAPSVSQHLAKLRMARLVRTRRDGTTIFYVWRTSTCASSSSTPFSTPSTPVPGFPATTVLPADCSRSLRHRLPRMSGKPINGEHNHAPVAPQVRGQTLGQ
ncbi:ArsR family transcriptional regulator [Mycobacterium tuberculosis]|nr:ArsR family transcriptional regulator [Mycobacterium tuberculosis]CKU61097.1 ArsR family transcriptional regulator [Mycobacterium tuberculosis]